MTIRAWLARRKAKREFTRGHSWARFTLATGVMTVEKIKVGVNRARDFGEYDAFDEGAEAALREGPPWQPCAGYPRVVMCGSTGIKAIVDSPEEEDDFHGCLVRPLAWLFLGALCMFIGGFLYWVIP